MNIKVYLFDFDDTIISTKIYAEIYQPILKMIKSHFKITDSQLTAKAQEHDLTKNRFGRWDTGDLCREFGLLEEYYKVLEDHIKVKPILHNAVIDTFKRLKAQKKKIAIVSNSMKRTLNLYLKKYELEKYLDFVFSRDDAQCKKKEEEYWKKLIKKHKLKPQECVVIGDDPVQDVQVPSKLGFHTFLISKPMDLEKIG